MTKLVKLLVIGGSSTAVAGGAAAGAVVAVTHKKDSTSTNEAVAKQAQEVKTTTKPTEEVKTITLVGTPVLPGFSGVTVQTPVLIENKEVFSGTSYQAVPQPIEQLVPHVAPQARPEIKVPALTPKMIVSVATSSTKVIGGTAKTPMPPLVATYGGFTAENHAELIAISGTPALPGFSGSSIQVPVLPEYKELFSGYAPLEIPSPRENNQEEKQQYAIPGLINHLELNIYGPSDAFIHHYATPLPSIKVTGEKEPIATPKLNVEMVAPHLVQLPNIYPEAVVEGTPSTYAVPQPLENLYQEKQVVVPPLALKTFSMGSGFTEEDQQVFLTLVAQHILDGSSYTSAFYEATQQLIEFPMIHLIDKQEALDLIISRIKETLSGDQADADAHQEIRILGNEVEREFRGSFHKNGEKDVKLLALNA